MKRLPRKEPQYNKPRVVPPKKPITIAKPPTVVKLPAASPTAEPVPATPDTRLELDAPTQAVLEDELQQIMIKVWQELPDETPSDTEQAVVDKLRIDACDQLKNVLGLNVTKRLLNTFNPLNVKVHFTTKPDRKYLRQFLKDYNFVAFKRIARVVNTFAAQVKTVADYDRLSQHKDIRCGAAKITITPFYKFRQCPKNLKTIYKVDDDSKDVEQEMEEDALGSSIEVNSPVKETEGISPTKSVTVKAENKDNDDSNAAEPKPAKPVDNEPKVEESKVPIEVAKPEAAKVAVNTQDTLVKTPNTQDETIKTEVDNTHDNKNDKDAVASTSVKTQPKASPPKASVQKPQPAQPLAKPEPKPKIENKATAKVVGKPKNIVKANKNITNKVNAKANAAVKAKSKLVEGKPVRKVKVDAKRCAKKSFEDKDDFEELDDEDILALISGGIVLDECSGSDVE